MTNPNGYGSAGFRLPLRMKEADLEAWRELYEKDHYDRVVLIGFSNALLRSPRLLREQWLGSDKGEAVLSTWRERSNVEEYRHIAGKWLVPLSMDRLTRIAEFERCLSDAPLSDEPAREAARLYIAALRRNRDWPRLRELLERPGADLFAACSFTERVITRTLAQLHALPDPGRSVAQWLRLWERLLALTMDAAEVLEMLQNFSLIRRRQRRRAALCCGIYDSPTLSCRFYAEENLRSSGSSAAHWNRKKQG